MPALDELCSALAADPGLREADVAAALAWFLGETTDGPVFVADVSHIIEEKAIRGRVNRSRLKDKLRTHPATRIGRNGEILVRLTATAGYSTSYGHLLARRVKVAPDHILEAADFVVSRQYVQKMVFQVNASYEYQLFDCAAVMMRRLMEVLIIDAYEGGGHGKFILKNGEYQPLSALIGQLTSGSPFKLSRGQNDVLERVKTLGDNAAHNRSYITKLIDIDEVKARYRRLIAELQHLGT